MRTKTVITLGSLIGIIVLGYFLVKSFQNSKIDEKDDLSQNRGTNAQSFTFKNLRLYPIRTNEALSGDFDNYITLREALKKEKIQIKEAANGSGEVNTLLIKNISKDTIYLMSGEIVQGGKQDRVIAENKIILPNEKMHRVPVFCVEQGRWEYDEESEDNDKFDDYYGVASMKLRKIVSKDKNQGKVWEEVERANEEEAVETSTSAYTARKKSKNHQKKYKEYYDFFMKKFAKEKNVIGVTGVTGNRVIGSDIFASPKLFQKQFPSILGAYINEALTDGNSVKIEEEEVSEYMDEVVENNKTDKEDKSSKSFKYKGKKLHYSTYSKEKKK